jgi:ribosomal-protein-alanine N-acetyltransferase
MTFDLPLPPTPTLETERLILRPVRQEDAPAIQRRFPQWEVVRWLHAVVPWPYPDDGAETHVRKCLEENARGVKHHWAITLRGSAQDAVGLIDLWPDDGVSRDMRGFWLDPALHGRGLMTEAAERVTAYAFEELGWPHLYLTNAEGNLASHRVKEKQGAQLIDRVAGQYVSGPGTKEVWLLTRDAWLARQAQLGPRLSPG